MGKIAQARVLAGFQDFLPEKMRFRNAVISAVKVVYERFGFLPQDTPCLEYADILLDKYGENQKLVYDFHDKGERHVAMRYDLTVPLGRVVQMYGGAFNFPYRRYQIGMVWRADKPGKGRYREFMQMDADIVGDNSMLADLEMILLNIEIMKTLGIRYRVRVNTRQVLDSLIEKCGLSQEKGVELVRSIDKFDKIGRQGVIRELEAQGFSLAVTEIVGEYLDIEGDRDNVVSGLEKLLSSVSSFKSALAYLRDFSKLIADLQIERTQCIFDPTIARGLDYYTGLIFETTFLDDPAFGSICSGGRYDRLITTASGEEMSSIGLSIGLDRLFAAMESFDLLPALRPAIDVFIINFGDMYLADYARIALRLRSIGLSVEIFSKPVKIAKQMKIANIKKAPYVLMYGGDEAAEKVIVVKSMMSGKQEKVLLERLEDSFLSK